MGLLQLMDEYHYKRLWEEYGERKSLKDLLAKIFYVFHNLVETDVFPTDWLIMKMVVNNIILNSLQELAQPLIFKFLNPRPQFDVQVSISSALKKQEYFTNVHFFNIIFFFADLDCLF